MSGAERLERARRERLGDIISVTIPRRTSGRRLRVQVDERGSAWGLATDEVRNALSLASELEMSTYNWPWMRSITIRMLLPDLAEVVIGMFAVERDGCTEIDLQFTQTFDVARILHGWSIHDFIRHAIKNVIEHELDESLFVGGVRKWDPHR